MGEYNASNYIEQGGARTVIGGSLDVISGGDLDIETGGSLKIAGTAITATAAEVNAIHSQGAVAADYAKLHAITADAAELNFNDGPTAGVATASKTAVLGASKNLDTICVAQDGFKMGASGAEVAVTSTPAELNTLDGKVAAATFVVGAEGGNVINVGVQLKDAAAVDMVARASVPAYLSNDANGDSLATTAPDGGVVIGTDGVAIPVTPALTNALLVHGNLAISAVPEKFKTTQASAFLIGGVSHTYAATDNLVFSAANVITASKFGVILIQINAAGTVSTKVPADPQAYDNAGAALAALPAADAGNVALGYIAIENNAGDWTANTDDLTNGSDLTTAAFNDTAETAIAGAKAWQLVSESDGDIDINITESGVATWYLALVLPNGALAVSGAITFA